MRVSLGFGRCFRYSRSEIKSRCIASVSSINAANTSAGCRQGIPEKLSVPEELNQSWSADFMPDALRNGRRFRTFNVVDDFNREALKVEVDLSLGSNHLIRALEPIAEVRGLPKHNRFENRPEFISLKLAEWAKKTA